MENDNSPITLAETALSIVQNVASAAAPPWTTVGVAASVIGDVLAFFFPPPSSSTPSGPTLTQIIGAVKREVENNTIAKAVNSIQTTANLFASFTQGSSVPLPSSADAGLQDDPAGQFAQLYHFLQNSVGGLDQDQLIGPTNSMANAADSDTQLAYLPTLALGVSTYVMIATFWISLLASINESEISEIDLSSIIFMLTSQTLQNQRGWIDYAHSVSKDYRAAVETRVAQVGNATPFCTLSIDGEMNHGVYFQDFGQGQPVPGFNPVGLAVESYAAPFPGNMNLDLVPDAASVVYAMKSDNSPVITAAVEILRNRYVANLRQALYVNAFDPNILAQTIAGWTSCAERLQALQSK